MMANDPIHVTRVRDRQSVVPTEDGEGRVLRCEFYIIKMSSAEIQPEITRCRCQAGGCGPSITMKMHFYNISCLLTD